MKIDQLDLLEKMFQTVKIPIAVYSELTINPAFKHEAELVKSKRFIDIVSVEDSKSVLLLQKATGLDKGESEAIILAEEMKANLLLMDERKGRQIATQMGNRITGTFGIIIDAYNKNLISSVVALQKFKQLKDMGIRINDSLYNDLIEKVSLN